MNTPENQRNGGRATPAANEGPDFVGALDTVVSQPETFPTPAEAAQDLSGQPLDRGEILAADGRSAAAWSLRFILIVAGAALALYLLKFVWIGLLPALLALIVCTVLWPVVRTLRKWKFPSALAVAVVLIGFLALIGAVFGLMAPIVGSQSGELISQAQKGITDIVSWAEQRFDIGIIDSSRVQETLQQAVNVVRGQASNIASGVLSGIGVVASAGTTLVLTLILTFFFLKDGDRFLPWLRKYVGVKAGWHLTEVLMRSWNTLAGFIRAQAIVSAVDAVFIGGGLLLLGVPLWPVLAVLTFFGGFIPIIGAFTAGALSVIVALVSNGLVNALLALLLVVAVQQLEGNILSPILQSRAMGLHAAIVLLSVTVGGTLFGIVGAFLAVPVAAVIAVWLGYWAEMTSLRAGEITPDDIKMVTQQSQTLDSREALLAMRKQLQTMGLRRTTKGQAEPKQTLGSTRAPSADEAPLRDDPQAPGETRAVKKGGRKDR
ncbi:AI-2 transport protein TqsA [Corynebacterium capitovis DSM 44611]|uniref:AI-2E family transporter n=1 Tax=Corynebacterium capitovis TaxID=131081 RepID=UPI000372F8BE|nr:AI-2E family transporter [Corynebacterium capitovis]WKD58241.1 AI-2 transport protein TqsA [Corynebacterium capitovis DSM 44611]